jgi:hypothetical protein
LIATSASAVKRSYAAEVAGRPAPDLSTIHRSAWNMFSRKLALLRIDYESTSEMKIVAPPVAKFGMSLGGACPSGVDRLLCNCSMSSK